MKKKQKLVSVWEKIGYSFGDFASNLFWMMFVFYGMFFYTDVFGIPAAAVGTMFFITKFWDAVNDPLMGIIADRTETKWGKYRPFLIWIVIPFAIIGVLAFTTPNFSISGKIIYAYVTYTLLMMAYTAINIPYSALMGVLTPNSEERTSISSYRFVAAFTGGLFIQALTLPLVGLYGGGAHSVIAVDIQPGHQIVIQEQGVGTSQLRVTIDRKQSDEALKKLSWLSDIFGGDKKIVKDKIVWVNTPEILSEVDTTDGNLYFVRGFQQKRLDLAQIFPDVNWDEVDYTIATINQRKGFQYTIGTYALIAIVFFMLTFLMTKERVHPPKHQKTTIRQDLKDLVSNKPWIIVGVMSLFTLGQVCIRNGAIMYYFKYFVGNTGYAKYFMVVGTAFNLVGVLCTDWLVRIIGSKKRVYFITMVGNGIFLISFFFLNSGQLALMFIVQLLSGFLSGPQAPLVWAMYADTADYSEWKKGTRATGLFFSAATFAQKMGWTLGGALAGWLLAIFGFKANVTQTAETILGIKLLMSMIPALPSILAGVMVLFYKLDKDFMKKIENDLKQRRKQSESK